MKTEIDFLRDLEADFEALAAHGRAPSGRPARAVHRPGRRVFALAGVAFLLLAGAIGYQIRHRGDPANRAGYAPRPAGLPAHPEMDVTRQPIGHGPAALVVGLVPPPSPAPQSRADLPPVVGGSTIGEQLAGAGRLPLVGPQIVKTAQLTVVVKRGGFDPAFQRASLVASRYGGYIDSSSTRGRDATTGRLQIRVPAQNFERAVQDLRALGTVESEAISGQDVTADYVDLQARIRTWEAQETVLLKLMSQATTVADTLRVQREVQDVQLTIERLKGQLRVLNDQTENSTIALTLREPAAKAKQQAAAPWLPSFGQAWRDTVRGFLGVIFSVVIGLGYLIPLSLLGLLAWFAYRRIRLTA